MNKIERMQELVKLILYYNEQYYEKDNPIISNEEWDNLFFELINLENETKIILQNSPTQTVGAREEKLYDTLKKHKHLNQLYSLEKCTTFEKLTEWADDIKKRIKDVNFIVEHKYDGLTLCLTYENGNLTKAATRGNGSIGELVTKQVKMIKSVPKKIDYLGLIEVQGEGIIKKSAFKKYNETAESPLKSERNAAAGAIRNLDPKITKERNLDFVVHGLNYIDKPKETESDAFNFLKNNGFFVGEFCIFENISDVIAEIKNIDSRKNELDVLIDGAVVKVNNLQTREKLGFTNRFPKGAIAYKFEAEEITTILKNVIWQTGRTGKITPIAELEEVFLAGANISRATLNNIGDIRRKGVKINSRVLIRRSNEVIPEVLSITEEFENSKEIFSPKNCPCCGEKLTEIGANLYCTNENCEDILKGKLIHFCSRNAMNIEGISDKTAQAMFNFLDVKTPDKLYNLTYEDLCKITKMESSKKADESKKAQNILSSINKSKTINLSNFIYALGINGVGEKASKTLANQFITLAGLQMAEQPDLEKIPDIGPVVALNVVMFFKNEKNIQIINNILSKGMNILNGKKVDKSNEKIAGKTFVITGSFKEFSREELISQIEEQGGKVSSSVSKKTDYVLAGENAGSKLEKAKMQNIKIISLSEFSALQNK